MTTNIEWARNPDGTKGESWNPVIGCTAVSEGCTNCYAKRMARRLAGRYGYPEYPNQFDVTLHPDRLEQPLRWRKPRRIFVCSMSDLFHEDVPDDFLLKVWRIMDECPQHTFLVLTKRPERMASFVGKRLWRKRWGELAVCKVDSRVCGVMLPNVWLGVTVELPKYLWRVEELLKVPAAVRFVSLEPMLGAIELGPYLPLVPTTLWPKLSESEAQHWLSERAWLDWIIVGGESGPGARPMHPDWVRSVRDQCVEAGVPFFFEQWGEWVPSDEVYRQLYDGNKGYRTQTRQLGKMLRVGKEAAGRMLDGRLWEEYPG